MEIPVPVEHAGEHHLRHSDPRVLDLQPRADLVLSEPHQDLPPILRAVFEEPAGADRGIGVVEDDALDDGLGAVEPLPVVEVARRRVDRIDRFAARSRVAATSCVFIARSVSLRLAAMSRSAAPPW